MILPKFYILSLPLLLNFNTDSCYCYCFVYVGFDHLMSRMEAPGCFSPYFQGELYEMTD